MPKADLIKIIVGTCFLCVFLLLAIWFFGGFTGLSEHGAGALIAGVVASMFLGIGLMVAVFVSHRVGYDEASYDASASRKPETAKAIEPEQHP